MAGFSCFAKRQSSALLWLVCIGFTRPRNRCLQLQPIELLYGGGGVGVRRRYTGKIRVGSVHFIRLLERADGPGKNDVAAGAGERQSRTVPIIGGYLRRRKRAAGKDRSLHPARG